MKGGDYIYLVALAVSVIGYLFDAYAKAKKKQKARADQMARPTEVVIDESLPETGFPETVFSEPQNEEDPYEDPTPTAESLETIEEEIAYNERVKPLPMEPETYVPQEANLSGQTLKGLTSNFAYSEAPEETKQGEQTLQGLSSLFAVEEIPEEDLSSEIDDFDLRQAIIAQAVLERPRY